MSVGFDFTSGQVEIMFDLTDSFEINQTTGESFSFDATTPTFDSTLFTFDAE